MDTVLADHGEDDVGIKQIGDLRKEYAMKGIAGLLGVCIAAVLGVGCAVPADPCPLPPEQHPEVWTTKPVLTSTGETIGVAYICTGENITVR